jgi:hypothetical protein
MTQHVTGLFKNSGDAARAVDGLMELGVTRDEISLIMSEGSASQFGLKEATKAPEGAVTGGVIGGTLGAIAAGVVTAATAGVGILATGPIMMAFAGLGAGAAVGGLTGALAGAGIPEHEAKFYESEIRDNGAILLGVSTDRINEDRITDLFDRCNAAKVAEHS